MLSRRPFLPAPLLLAMALSAVALAACATSNTNGPDEEAPLTIGAIPDQDPEVLARLYDDVAARLSDELGVAVEYVPVTDYAAAVTLFSTGDLDLVWFGGLTGVQARLQTPGATALAQRDIDGEFHSVFIASGSSGIEPFDSVDGLSVLSGRRFTFGSESSTSGRLMPQYFLQQAGVEADEFVGAPGFSGAHDRTIELVASGSYEAGVLNEQVWIARSEDGTVDPNEVYVIFRTPAYHDYHWVVGPDVDERFGDGFSDRITAALLGLDPADADDAEILEAFGAGRFIETSDANYAEIEAVARDLGLIGE